MTDKERELYYDEVIAPRLAEIASDCHDHDVPFTAACEISDDCRAETTSIPHCPTFAFLLAMNAIRCKGNFDTLAFWVIRFAMDNPEVNNSVAITLLMSSRDLRRHK